MCGNCLTPWKCNGPHIEPCDNCGRESVMDDGIVGAHICDSVECFDAIYDRVYLIP